MAALTVGVLALQGGFSEHLDLLRTAQQHLASSPKFQNTQFTFIEVRTPHELAACDALIIPGGESTAISLVAADSGLLEPLRDFVKIQRKPTWGTCAGLILLSDEANATKKGGQELIGGLAVRVHRNHFGRQIESFQADVTLPFLSETSESTSFPGVFIRAPVVEEILAPTAASDEQQQQQDATARPKVEVLAKLPGRVDKMKSGMSQATTTNDSGDIVAVRQGNILGTSFHPELTKDFRIHVWWLQQILKAQS